MSRQPYVPDAGVDGGIDRIIYTHDFIFNVAYIIRGSEPEDMKYNWIPEEKHIENASKLAGSEAMILFLTAYNRDGNKSFESNLTDTARIAYVGIWIPKQLILNKKV